MKYPLSIIKYIYQIGANAGRHSKRINVRKNNSAKFRRLRVKEFLTRFARK